MRFSIRDLLWLMAAVALGATVFVERAEMRRRAVAWTAERVNLEQKSADALAIREARIRGLYEQNVLLQHQLVGSLERERKLEETQQREAAARASLLRPAIAIPNSDGAAGESEK